MSVDKDTPVDDLKEDMTPAEAAEIFATEYDETIHSMLHVLEHVGYSGKDFDDLLDRMKMLMEACIDIPPGMTVEQSMPYVWISDLLTLGSLAHEVFKRKGDIVRHAGMGH